MLCSICDDFISDIITSMNLKMQLNSYNQMRFKNTILFLGHKIFHLNSFNVDLGSGNCDRGINQEIEKI